LGKYCTRSCRFCAIETRKELSCPDKNELLSIREAVRELKLQHVVITSVTRDDLIDGGAGHFADCIKVLRDEGAHLDIEVLVPDFQGNKQSIKEVVSAKPDILAHNVETVPRLYRNVRPEALYKRSLEVLRFAKDLDPSLVTKSGMMLGLGETRKEIYSAMKDLRAIGCDIITIGQYLKGDMGCLDVEEFLAPEEFDKMSVFAKEIGFKESFCGPFIRSSYK
jgi:lipoic acid synthetase|tara:strand:+ start:805 stop:1470 length:666 start_codon:yes stop_codon:yes gene_type:complete